ncbi:MAG: type II secretion system protein [Patescibacteria group bacterium]
MRQAKGFTLIELLIVIAILAILATVVLLVINPVQMFAQARDSQRIYDINTLSNATALYLTTATSPDLDHTGGFVCGTNYGATVTGAAESFVGSGTIYAAFTRVVTGLGWVPVAFTSITGGSPLNALPIDPTNTVASTYSYTYACDNTNKWFEFDANMESDRYRNGASGANDVESTDGGDTSTIYEVGNDPGLDL